MRRIYLSPFFGKIAFLFILIISGSTLSLFGQNVPELIYYKFDGAGATTPNLASSPVGTNPAPVTGLTMGNTGQFGSALIGNGGPNTTNNVNSGWPLNLGTGPWTISFWLNNFPATASTTQYFFGGGGGSTFRMFTGGVAGNNAILLRGTGLTDVPVTNIGTAPVVIHFVRETTPASVIKVYRNGVLESTVAQATPTITGTDFWVGAYSGTTTSFPSGTLMDEFRLYNRALDAAEVGATWNITLPGGPCTSPPVTGTVTSSANPVCLNTSFTLGTTGGSFGTGQTYQWQISPDNSSWSNIVGATNSTLTTSQTTTNWYRVSVTCGASTVNSAGLQVLTPAGVAGTFTINNNQPTGGTNFQSFNAAYDYIRCGITGAVTFNVDPLSGPYNEQLIMTPVPGASASSTVTFNGNGRVLQFLSTNTNERAVIKLNGADYIIFDSLTINALGTTTTEYGFGVQLLNNADTNIVRKCTINITDASTSTNYAGISISASATSATGTGTAACDGNLFSQNTIKGGYYGITNVSSDAVANQRNSFERNIIRDYYIYGFYANGTFRTNFDGNNISRPSRANIGTADSYGIYFTALSTSAKVNGNYIHGLLDVNVNSTNDVYGIYFNNVDALGGLENVVSNNAIYDIKSNGIIYGIYNSGSNNVFYYHNTISLDDAGSTTTEVTRGFYQTTLASGIEFKNNMITLRRGGTGQMHGLYFNTATSTIVSNFNNVFFTPAANVNYGFSAANQATLANWQTATSQDANSQYIDPLYVNATTGNLLPTNPLIDDKGTPVPVTVDIRGFARSATTPDIGAWEFTVGNCIAPPTPGEATSSVSTSICPNEPVQLGLINNSIGMGQTYQWQSATSLAGPWTNVGPSSATPTLNINPVTTLYYRVAVTCSGNTSFSTAVQVFVNAFFPAGTYTINKTLPTTWPGAGVGSNFNSFNAAYSALRCGIAGPVTFNVVSGTGPYNEQVLMEDVQGTSQTNTVTFNGNGETITFLSTNTDERAVFKLNGTDHFIFDSLVVVPQGSTTSEYGFGFHLTNNADSNIIRNSIINLSTTTTSTNFAGIVVSAGIAATTTGATLSDYNVFDDNTITGGYYGITLVGSTTEAVGNNVITNNRIRDYYSYGVYLSGNFNTLVEKNDFSRPVRSNSTTVYGVYMTTLSTSVKISKNRIHNMFDAQTASTSTFGGIYITGVDALSGLENVVSNNAIYNINGNGTVYGMYNAGSDNVSYYYNTINLDHPGATTTSDTYGFYQTTSASGIELRNNLFNITRGGAGDKYALFFNTAATTWTSNYNNLYRNAQNAYTGYNGTNQLTLANWQAATSQDANSVAYEPFFTDVVNGNLAPRSPALDNRGTPITTITTDINNVVRSATTPDIGAWEFTVPACVAPPVAGTATAVPNTGICLGTPIDLNLTGGSFGAGQSYQWQVSANIGGPYTLIGTPMQFPDTTILASGTFYYQAVVICSGQSVVSTPVLVNMNPPFPAGTYTINNTQPTTWPGAGVGSNFNSFVEAVAVMECGIAGAVTFNVAPGTYTEQVRMHRITGASSTSRVTFQSANGIPASVILTNSATAAASNYTLQLDSASYITYRGITINATNATYGRAIDIANTASFDSIVNCVINVPASSLTTTTIVGIHGALLVGGDHVIKGNTVNGGNSGIYLSGSAAATPTRNNIVDSNFVNTSFQYGIYLNNARFNTVRKNVITVTAPRATTAYGIYILNNDTSFNVISNRVTINGTTTTNYGIFLSGSIASPNYPSSISSNKVLALTGNTGTLYGIYQTTSQSFNAFNNVVNVNTSATTSYGLFSTGGNGGIKFFNNSVQNSSPASGTANAAASFTHSSSSVGMVDIQNNIFTHTANGIAMYQDNAYNIYSDYNMYYTAGPILIRDGTGATVLAHATLQAWKNARDWDYNSIVYTPAFLAGNELQPAIADPNVWAMHGRGVQLTGNNADINGNTRSVNLLDGVPDLGAYEFLPTVEPPVLPSTPASPAAGTTQVFMFGTDTVQKITWAPASTVPASVSVKRYSGIIPPGLGAGQQSMYFYTDVDATGSAPTNFTMQQFYIESWMRNIPSEPSIKLGRTNASNVWLVSSTSTVDFINNVITEPNLSYLDKFTGMTDGSAPPQPPVVVPIENANKGKLFWVAYAHSWDFFSASNAQEMVLYISADQQTANVQVKVNGTNWVRNYTVAPNSVVTSTPMPKGGFSDARLLIEGMTPRGISIESDIPVTVYAHIYGNTNSGATMLLPVGTYGYEYYTLNSRQNYTTTNSHSSFFVIAYRDSTQVEITPSNPTFAGRPAGVPFTVTLQKGQVYQVLGAYISGAEGYDLTGSHVKSIPNSSGNCYPIAVFAGSTRTGLGCGTSAGGSGDLIFQQVFPSQAWGRRYLTAPTSTATAANSFMTNIYRVMVKDPTTVVQRNGTPLTGLINNRYYQFESNATNDIQSDKPIMVAQYMSSSSSCPNTSGNGDPEMFYLSPVEQAIKATGFYRNTLFNIDENYLTLIIPTAGLASLTIDGSSTFTHTYAHSSPGYSVVVQRWLGAAGQSYVQSDSAFTGIVYGLGSAESYGYNMGTLVKNLSAVPSINNVFNTGSSNSYTCKGTPFRFNLNLSIKPTQLIWNLSAISTLSPNANITQNNPVPADSALIDGRWIYRFTLPTDYTFAAVGNYVIPIRLYHPSIEGCSGFQEVTLPISVINAPVTDFTSALNNCVGNAIQFNGVSTHPNNVPITQWSWNFGDATTAAVQNPIKTYTAAGTYNVSLRAIAQDGCVGDTTKQLIVSPRPIANVVDDTVFACTNSSVTFTILNPVAGATYSWYDAATGGNLLGTGTTFTVNNLLAQTNYWVEGVVNGCASITRTRVTAAILPNLNAPVLTVDSIGTNILIFRWTAVPNAVSYEVSTNGGGTWTTPSSGSTGLSHTIQNLPIGTTVTLIVRANGGCLPALSQPATATTRSDQIFIPNAFTPNGDGLNDVLRVYSNVIRQMRFVVFNQWGEKIFESNDQNTAWDGTHQGKPQPSGVYMYVCDITLNTGERIQRKGAINLVR